MSVIVDPTAPDWARRLVMSINAALVRLRVPQTPVRQHVIATANERPAASDWPFALLSVRDMGSGAAGFIFSDGENWFPVTLGSAL